LWCLLIALVSLRVEIALAGGALRFDGGQLTTVPDSPSLNLSTEATLEVWVLPSTPILQPARIIAKGDGSDADTDRAYELVLETSTLWFQSEGISVSWFTGDKTRWTLTDYPWTFAPGEWVHIASTYTLARGGHSEVYINGKLVYDRTCSASGWPIDHPLFPGTYPLVFGSGGLFYSGLMDEVRIWNVARSPTEIAASYDRVIDPKAPGLVGYYRFDEPDGSQLIADSSQYANNGYLGDSAAPAGNDPVRVTSTVPLACVWNVDSNGGWGALANWREDVPDRRGASAYFLDKLTETNAPDSISLDGNRTVGRIAFDNQNSYRITRSGAQTLTLDNGSQPAEVRVLSGSHTIAAPVPCAGDAVISIAALGELHTTEGISIGPGRVLTKDGEGLWDAVGGIAGGSGSTLRIQKGKLTVDSYRGGSLSIGAGAAMVLKPGGGSASVSVASNLLIDGENGRWLGTLDITDSVLIVRADASSAEAALGRIIAQVRSARDGELGRWTGPGITSSTAAADKSSFTGLAAIRNKHRLGGTLFDEFRGQAVDSSSIIIRCTWNGDATLDGVINADDYFLIDNGFITQAAGYLNGDFNYDGVVNADDYFLIDSSFIGQSGPLSVRALSVPEPAATLMVLGAAALLIRRRGMHDRGHRGRAGREAAVRGNRRLHAADGDRCRSRQAV